MQPVLGVELCVPGEQLAGEGDARSLAAPGDEHARELLNVGLGAGAEQRARQQRAPLVGDRSNSSCRKETFTTSRPSTSPAHADRSRLTTRK